MTHSPPVVVVVNNQLYSIEYTRNEVTKHNMENNTWSVMGSFPFKEDSMKCLGLALKDYGN